MVQLHRHAELDPRPLQRAFRDAAGRRSFLPHKQRLIGKRVRGDVPTSSPCVLGRDNEDKFIAHSGRQTFLARPKSMPADDPKIELAFPDSSLDGLRIGDLELHIYARVFGPKRRNDSGQHVEPRSRAGADQERPMSQAIQLSERLTPALNRGDGTLRKLRDDTACLGHGDNPAASPTEEQLLSQFGFELADVFRQRWLRRMDFLRRQAEALFPGDGEKDLELPQRHFGFSLCLRSKHRIGPYSTAWRMTSPEPEKEALMIFRHFLSPKTGCASYLFG